MIRSTFRNVMLLLLVASFGVAFFVFRKTQDMQMETNLRQNEIIRLRQELENTQSLNVALNELDNLTITEQTATQLDILRHLGLEQSNLSFELESRDIQSIGATSLYVHNVRIRGSMPYEIALQLADRLQGTKKIVFDAIEIAAQPGNLDGHIDVNLAGKIYGLEKLNTAPAVPEETPVAEAPTPEDATLSAPDVSSTLTPETLPADASATAIQPAPQETMQ